MTAADGPRPGAAALGRGAAVLAAAGALVHVLLLDPTSLASLAMVATAAVCLPCAWRLWRRPTPAAWRTTVLADLTMLALHLQAPAGGTAHATHSAHSAHSATSPGGLATAGLVLVAGSLAAGAVALTRDRRTRRRAATPLPAGVPT